MSWTWSSIASNVGMACSTIKVQSELESLTTKKETVSLKNHQLKEDLAVMNTELQSMQQRKENFSKRENILDEAWQNLQLRLLNKDVTSSNLKPVLTIVKQLEQDLESFQKESPFFYEKINDLFKSGTGVRAKFRSLQNQAENLSREIENANVSVQTLENKYLEQTGYYLVANSEKMEVEKEYSDVQTQLLKQSFTDLFSGELTELNGNGKSSLEERKGNLEAKIVKLKSKMAVYFEVMLNLQPEVDNLGLNVAQLQKEADKLIGTSDSVSREREDFLGYMENTRKDLKEFQDTIKHLQEKINAAEEKIQRIENEEKMLELQQSRDNDSPKNVNITNVWSNQIVQNDGNTTRDINVSMGMGESTHTMAQNCREYKENQIVQNDVNTTRDINVSMGMGESTHTMAQDYWEYKEIFSAIVAILGICIFMGLLFYRGN